MDKTKEYITFSIPATPRMLAKLEELKPIRKYLRIMGDRIHPYTKKVTDQYIEASLNLELRKFAYDSLGGPDEPKIKYSHQMEINGITKRINFIRVGGKTPGVLEIMNLNHNLNLN